MIEYDCKNWFDVILRVRGSVLPRLLGRIVVTGVLGVVAAWSFQRWGIRIPLVLHTLLGVVLGLLMVFRTNASYDRYWEGRRLGGMVNRTRDLTRQLSGGSPIRC